MTKHGHQTFEEFKETWNLTIDDAKVRMYDMEKERWIFNRRAQAGRIAIANIEELMKDSSIDSEQKLEDIKKTIDRYHERCRGLKW